ncbi:hypothetical protein Sjap_003113 [Stephania japonica]|uniref:Uncharacterized protein n=1 Tax=Stephania japonica TaxID=461633 RepID=A0AAP0PT75_9MAGN
MDGQTPTTTSPTTQQEAGETSDHTTREIADLRAMVQRVTDQQLLQQAEMVELMEYIRSSRIPAVAPTVELVTPTPPAVLAPPVDTQAAGTETVIERSEPVVIPANNTEVTPTTTEQHTVAFDWHE